MKTTILKMKYVLFIGILVFVMSCSSDDDSADISIPTVNYTSTTIDATFFEAGNSIAPNVIWNGNQGVFSIASSLTGLSINGNTGVLSWTKLLPPGAHAIQVITTNSAGQQSVNLTLENKFEGNFSHKFESTCSYEVQFVADGAINIRYIGGEDIIADGSWTIENNEVTGNYMFLDNSQESLKATIAHSISEVRLEGNWYNGSGAVLGQEGGNVNLNLGELPAGDGIVSQMPDSRYRIHFYGICGGACCFDTIQEALNAYPDKSLTFVP